MKIGFIPFVPDVADQIRPGDAVGGFDEPGVSDGAEGLADVGGVGDVAVGGEEDGAEAGGVGGVADVAVGGGGGAGGGGLEGVLKVGRGGRGKGWWGRRRGGGRDLRSVVERF